MEKNKRVLIVLGILIVGIGISLAYFVGKMLTGGEGATTKVLTANIKNSEVTIEGILNIEDLNMLPGHQSASGIKVNAKGNNELIPFNIIWEGTNTLGSKLNFKVYKSSKQLNVDIDCKEVRKPTGGGTMLYEECSINNEEELGEVIQEGEIPISETPETVNIALDQFITSTEDPGTDIYYYVIIEYPNEDKNQNDDMLNKSFKGELKIEASETEADVNIFAAYIEQEDGSYEKVEDIPQEGYTINKDKSKCSKGAIPSWDTSNKRLYIENFKKIGTECYLYFMKQVNANDYILANRTTEKGQDGFTDIDTEEHKDGNNKSILYSDTDDLGTTYYYRGKVKDNWVKFGEENGEPIWWRIIRINGNGSIRMIYTGTGETAPTNDGYLNNNGAKSQLNIGGATTFQYNEYRNDNKYVGYMYGTQRTGSAGSEGTPTTSYTQAHANNYDSDIKKILDDWYKTHLKISYGQYIDPNAGFCNDRKINTQPNQWWSSDTSMGYAKNVTVYVGWNKLRNASSDNANIKHLPTFKCSQTSDIFTLPNAKKLNGSDYGNHKLIHYTDNDNSPVGLIAIDEAVYAGGYYFKADNSSNNNQFYLYTGQYYWTMSPSSFRGGSAEMFAVFSSGYLSANGVGNTYGVRPVINLSADVMLSGDGTHTNPYIVENT